MKKYSLDELKKQAEDFFKNHPKESTVLATSDGNFFLNSKESAARSHANRRELIVYPIDKSESPDDDGKQKSKATIKAEEKVKAEADAKAKSEADEKAKAEADAKAKSEADEKAKAEADAKAKAESDEKAKAGSKDSKTKKK